MDNTDPTPARRCTAFCPCWSGYHFLHRDGTHCGCGYCDPCNRPAPAATEPCTGATADWCPVHGSCRCPDPAAARNDPGCPLHARDSDHPREAAT